jgi:hypothetical protein
MPFTAYSEEENIVDAVALDARWFVDDLGTNPFSGAFKWYGVGPTDSFGAEYVIRLSDGGIVVETNTVC